MSTTLLDQIADHLLRRYASAALRFWEPRRLIYICVLATVVIAHFILAWPLSRERVDTDHLLGLFCLSVIANFLYCAAYPADILLQLGADPRLVRTGRRILFTVGTLFAATLAHFFSTNIFRP